MRYSAVIWSLLTDSDRKGQARTVVYGAEERRKEEGLQSMPGH
jgi:hypothetical protein